MPEANVHGIEGCNSRRAERNSRVEKRPDWIMAREGAQKIKCRNKADCNPSFCRKLKLVAHGVMVVLLRWSPATLRVQPSISGKQILSHTTAVAPDTNRFRTVRRHVGREGVWPCRFPDLASYPNASQQSASPFSSRETRKRPNRPLLRRKP